MAGKNRKPTGEEFSIGKDGREIIVKKKNE